MPVLAKTSITISSLLMQMLNNGTMKNHIFSGKCLIILGLLAVGGAAWSQPSRIRPGKIVVRFAPFVSAQAANMMLSQVGGRTSTENSKLRLKFVSVPAGRERSIATALNQRAGVEFAEPDFLIAPTATPNDPLLGNQWYIQKLAAPNAWNLATGAGVTIAILDTGCDPAHPDLQSRYTSGWNFYDNNNNWSDVYGHGTAVAGCAAGTGNNALGIAGVSWGSQIMPIRISDLQGYGSSASMANGLTWAGDRGARVANISYRVSTSQAVRTAAQYFMSKGGVVTISAGNQAEYDPAPDNEFVLTVSATTSSDALSSFSNTGTIVDVAAPGSGIYTTARGGSYASYSGTSFSAPITAGVTALVISANPFLSGPQVQNIVKMSADDLGASGWDALYGYGRVNAVNAVNLALGAPVDTTPPTASFVNPTQAASVSNIVNIQVNAVDNISVSSVRLYLNGVLVRTFASGPYNHTWDSKSVANGSHTWQTVVTDSSNNVTSTSVTVVVANVIDTTVPSVNITSPSSGVQVSGSFALTASASDNVGVTRVELFVNGTLSSTDSVAPYSFNINSRPWKRGTINLQVRAYDAAGNSATSSISVTK